MFFKILRLGPVLDEVDDLRIAKVGEHDVDEHRVGRELFRFGHLPGTVRFFCDGEFFDGIDRDRSDLAGRPPKNRVFAELIVRQPKQRQQPVVLYGHRAALGMFHQNGRLFIIRFAELQLDERVVALG